MFSILPSASGQTAESLKTDMHFIGVLLNYNTELQSCKCFKTTSRAARPIAPAVATVSCAAACSVQLPLAQPTTRIKGSTVNWKEMSLYRRLYLFATGVLVTALIAGSAIYVTASSGDSSASNYQIIGGQVYASNPSDSKAYNDQLARMGGRSAVFADQFNRWFSGLWRGQNLGLTIIVLGTILALVLLWIGREVERDHEYRNPPRSNVP